MCHFVFQTNIFLLNSGSVRTSCVLLSTKTPRLFSPSILLKPFDHDLRWRVGIWHRTPGWCDTCINEMQLIRQIQNLELSKSSTSDDSHPLKRFYRKQEVCKHFSNENSASFFRLRNCWQHFFGKCFPIISKGMKKKKLEKIIMRNIKERFKYRKNDSLQAHSLEYCSIMMEMMSSRKYLSVGG